MAQRRGAQPWTNHVRGIIRGGRYEDEALRARVDALFRLERWVIEPPRCMAASLEFHGIRRVFPDDFLAIVAELAPPELDRWTRRHRREARGEARMRRERVREAARARASDRAERRRWFALGGWVGATGAKAE